MDPQTRALGDIFENPDGTEYPLHWTVQTTGGVRGGTITATDLLFNYFFNQGAFGTTLVRTVDVAGSTYTRRRRIGGTAKSVTRKPYTVNLFPTSRGGAIDGGKQLYVKDGAKWWNFELSGRITDFDLWLDRLDGSVAMKRPFIYKTATGAVHGKI
jgi:hypothetical protein